MRTFRQFPYNYAIFYVKNNVEKRIDKTNIHTAEKLWHNFADQIWTSEDKELEHISLWNMKTIQLLEVLSVN